MNFYLLDLDRLSDISNRLLSGAPESLSVSNGAVRCSLEAEDGDVLFTSIPYDTGWRIRVNGETIEPGIFAQCFLTVPLRKGTNEITLDYHVPFLRMGLVISILGLLLIVLPETARSATSLMTG